MRSILLLLVGLALVLTLVACSDTDDTNGGTTPQPTAAEDGTPTNGGPPPVEGEPTVTASGLQIIDITVGDGEEVPPGATITAHYTGWLEDGTQFDSSVGGQPLTRGLNGVITGWTEGVPGMKVGGKRRLIIPPELAYGPGGSGSIPPNATLTFDIELIDFQ